MSTEVQEYRCTKEHKYKSTKERKYNISEKYSFLENAPKKTR